MSLKKIVSWGVNHPQLLFLIDGIGALLSAFLWGVVFVHLESFTGIPAIACYFLAMLPASFVIYDLVCYLFVKKKRRAYLRIIAFLNVGYVFVSITMLFFHAETISFFGISYLFLEVAVILTLVTIELRATRSLG